MSLQAEPSFSLRVATGDRTAALDFPPDSERAYTVGADPSADFRISGPGVPPVLFYLEREDTGVVLVPAYCNDRLRLDGKPVSRPRLLARSGEVVFGTLRFSIDRTDEPNARPVEEDRTLAVITSTSDGSCAGGTRAVTALAAPFGLSDATLADPPRGGSPNTASTLVPRSEESSGPTARRLYRRLRERVTALRRRCDSVPSRKRSSIIALFGLSLGAVALTIAVAAIGNDELPRPTAAPSSSIAANAPRSPAPRPVILHPLIEPDAIVAPEELLELRATAVRHLLAGRLREAATAYRTLATAAPDEPVYAETADLLQRRLSPGSAELTLVEKEARRP